MGRGGRREVFIFRISSCDERSQTLTPQTRIIVAVGQRVSEAAVPEPVTPEPGNLRVSFFSDRALKSLTLARSCTLHPQLRRTSRALRSGLVLLGSKDVNSTLTSGRSIPLSSTCSSGEGKTPQTSPRFSTAILPNDSSFDHSARLPATSDAPMADSTRSRFVTTSLSKRLTKWCSSPTSRRDHPEVHPQEFFVESSQPVHRQSSTMGPPEETNS